ncbi:11051_t:CDS:2, partial [Entrophospora sp. SA101]
MHELLDQQLRDYLSTIISEASVEKNKDINTINDLVTKYNVKTGNIKWCNQCGMREIENLKRRCPQCNALLPLLADFQKKEQEITPSN